MATADPTQPPFLFPGPKLKASSTEPELYARFADASPAVGRALAALQAGHAPEAVRLLRGG